ncbi:hypothetical protein PWG14_12745, partial (plasmid) [Chromobacterium amazonense]|uniref:hypothetical protein n=1 Tax=Chromobacterium amazonense TaxID=1382803 RepID=UPI00237D8FC1
MAIIAPAVACQNRRQVFGGPIVFAGGDHLVAQDDAGALAAAQFHAFFPISVGQARQHEFGEGCVHQQRFHGVAGAVAVGLGVQRDVESLVRIGGVVDVDMAVAVQMLDHRHPR